jgi:CheY-like chemotaxis protein
MLKKFWLAEDDSDDLDFFIEALLAIDQSISVVSAQNGQELLEKLSSSKFGNPDLIFLDINMPIMDGWECLHRLKKNVGSKDIPVVMYSTSSAMKNGQRAIDAGAFCFYEKPNSFLLLKDFL